MLYAQFGFLDTSFNHTGRSYLLMNERAIDAVALPGGKTMILADHSTGVAYGNEMSLIRLNENGTIDTSFGASGVQTIHSSIELKALAMKTGPDHSIYVLGDDLQPGLDSKGAIIKLDTNGNKVNSFGINGEFTILIPAGDIQIFDFDLDPEDGLYVVGNKNNVPWHSFIMHVLADGSLDTNFGSGGLIYPTSGSSYRFMDIQVVDSNRIVAAGGSGALTQGYLFMFDAAGVADSAFGSNGHRQFTLNGLSIYCESVKVTPAKKLLLAGKSLTGQRIWLAMMDISGTIDTSYCNGTYFHYFRPGAMDESMVGLAVADSGSALLGVRSQGPSYCPPLISLLRLLPDGSVDSGFGNNGVFQDSSMNSIYVLKTLFRTSENKIVMTGYNDYNLINPMAIRIEGRMNQVISSDTSIHKVYGDTPFVLGATSSSGLPCTIQVADTSLAFCTTDTISILNAGNTSVGISVAGNATYCPQSISIPFTIDKKALQVTAADTFRMINTPNPLFRLEYTGWAWNDDITCLDTLPAVSTTAMLSSPAGSYAIIPSGGWDRNYDLSHIPGILTLVDPSGIADMNEGRQTLRLYPNPASDYLMIALQEGENLILVIDNMGRELLREQVPAGTGTVYRLELEPIPAGIYHLRVSQGGAIRSGAFIRI